MKLRLVFATILLLGVTASADDLQFFTSVNGFGPANDKVDWSNFQVTGGDGYTWLTAEGQSQLGLQTDLRLDGFVFDLYNWDAVMTFTFAQPVSGVGLTLYPGRPFYPYCSDGPCPTVWMWVQTLQGEAAFYLDYRFNWTPFIAVGSSSADIVSITVGAYDSTEPLYLFGASSLSVYDFGRPAPVPEPVTFTMFAAGVFSIVTKLARGMD